MKVSTYYITSDGQLYNHDELMHYGVIGMKWGVRKAQRLSGRNKRLEVKAAKYDKKAANLTKKAEKAHAKHDLGARNRNAVKAAKLDKKAAKFAKKAAKTDSDFLSSRYQRKAAKAEYKATTKRIKGNRVSKTTGYGARAMRYSVKSDKASKKAAKARMKIANNKHFESRLNKKISELSREELSGAYSFVNEYKGS